MLSSSEEELIHMDDSVDLIGWRSRHASRSAVVALELHFHVIVRRDNQSGLKVTPSVDT